MISSEEILKQITTSKDPEAELTKVLWSWYDQGYYDCAEEMGEVEEENS